MTLWQIFRCQILNIHRIQIRKDYMDGKFYKYCRHCPYKEEIEQPPSDDHARMMEQLKEDYKTFPKQEQ
jgi:hypothetical protein